MFEGALTLTSIFPSEPEGGKQSAHDAIREESYSDLHPLSERVVEVIRPFLFDVAGECDNKETVPIH